MNEVTMRDESEMYTGFNPLEKTEKKTIVEWIAGAAYGIGRFWHKIKAVENEVNGVSETEDQQSLRDDFLGLVETLKVANENTQHYMNANEDLRVELATTLRALRVISGELILSATEAKDLLERHTVEHMRTCTKAPPDPPGTSAGAQGPHKVKVGKDFNRKALEHSAEDVTKNPRWRNVAKPEVQSQGEDHE